MEAGRGTGGRPSAGAAASGVAAWVRTSRAVHLDADRRQTERDQEGIFPHRGRLPCTHAGRSDDPRIALRAGRCCCCGRSMLTLWLITMRIADGWTTHRWPGCCTMALGGFSDSAQFEQQRATSMRTCPLPTSDRCQDQPFQRPSLLRSGISVCH